MDLSLFNRIEKEKGLLDVNVDGFYYWIYGRRLISEYIQTDSYGQLPVHVNSFSDKLKIAFNNCIDSLYMIGRKYEHSDVLLFANQRRYFDGKYYVDPIADDLISEYDSSVMIECGDNKHLKPCKTRNVRYFDIYTLVGYANCYFNKYILSFNYRRIYNSIYLTINDAVDAIFSAYEVHGCSPEYITEKLTEYYFVYRYLKKKYSKIINKISPKIIIEVWHCTLEKMLLTEMAKDKGIPVVELQHGNCGKENLAYNYPQGTIIKQFPDYFFSFSEYWTDNSAFPIEHEKIVAVGSPYIENKRKKIVNMANQDNRAILVLTDVGNTDVLIEMVLGLSKRLKNKYKVIVKLHPLDDVKRLMKYSTFVSIYSSKDLDLYTAFSNSFCIVCTGSTTSLFEGLDCGLDGYVYYPKAMDDFKELCDKKYVYGFNDSEELEKLILNNEQIRTTQETVFFLNDSLKKQKYNIDRIVEMYAGDNK